LRDEAIGIVDNEAPRAERLAEETFVRIAPEAAFLSQLIASAQRLPPQRQRRRASPGAALGAYEKVGRSGVRRMPAGWRTTRIV
jgi:hypothetical protein